MSDFEEEARKRQAALALLGDHGDGSFEEVSHEDTPLSQRDGLMSEEEVFGEDTLDRADRAQRRAPDDSLAQKSLIRQGVWSDLQKIAPFERINPPSVLQGTVGGQQSVLPGENKQVAFWSGVDAETLPVTITFSPVDVLQKVDELTSFSNKGRPYGIVQFGTRGMLVKAFVDIGRGCQFTVNASEVTLQVACETLFSPTSVGRPFKLAGMLSFYPTTHTAPITRTVVLRNADISVNIGPQIIPPFARGVQVLAAVGGATVGNSPAVRVSFVNANGTLIQAYTYPATVAGLPVLPTGFIPIPNGADVINLFSDAPTSGVVIIYELAF